jgi:hypothetical protein
MSSSAASKPSPDPPPPPKIRSKSFVTCKRISLCVLLGIILPIVIAIALVVIPLLIADSHESTYFATLEADAQNDRSYARWSKSGDELLAALLESGDIHEPSPWNQRRLPLTQDLTQLSSGGWQQQMTLNPDWTSEYPAQEFWVYVGGTAPPPPSPDSTPGLFSTLLRQGRRALQWFLRYIVGVSLPGHNCVDPAHLCDAFNGAFNSLVEQYHTHRAGWTGRATLTFGDCDLSPGLCDAWAYDPVFLVHINTHSPCAVERDPTFRFVCAASYRFVSLPLEKMPFARRVWASTLSGASRHSIRRDDAGSAKGGADDFVVEVFPSAFEQLHALISYDGAFEALEYDEDHKIDVLPPVSSA